MSTERIDTASRLQHTYGDARVPAAVQQRIVAGAQQRLQRRKLRWLAVPAGALAVALMVYASAPVVTDTPVPEVATHAATPAPTLVPAHATHGTVHTPASPARAYRLGKHTVQVGNASQVRFESLDPNQVALHLGAGRVECKVDPLPAGGVFAVQTERLRVEVVGTLFEVTNTDTCTSVRVSEGTVRVKVGDGVALVHAGDALEQCDEAETEQEPANEPTAAPKPRVAAPPPASKLTPAPSDAGEELIATGLAAMESAQLTDAVTAFEAYLAAHPQGDFVQEALFNLVLVHMKNAQPVAARAHAATFERRFGDTRRAARLRSLFEKKVITR